ncbi:RNA 2'-phosphotransferase [Agrobacterium rubi]|nr:RNA 2'-phosphotransferase [Agrobacterium rubi]NTF24258.1 RNA 2'-phosphotransferase [Agrobacterium rubi]
MKKDMGRTLTYVLRHAPEEIGIVLDAAGWTAVDKLLTALRKAGYDADMDKLRAIVAADSKQRFTLSDDERRIRAAQGHSVKVSLGVAAVTPPDVLLHGTAATNLDSIFATGLNPGSRQQVHLSSDVETALKVGGRHGRPVVLKVDAAAMQADGFSFFRADNGVWLTDSVPAKYLSF